MVSCPWNFLVHLASCIGNANRRWFALSVLRIWLLNRITALWEQYLRSSFVVHVQHHSMIEGHPEEIYLIFHVITAHILYPCVLLHISSILTQAQILPQLSRETLTGILFLH